jgi:hypothetical protein
MRWIMVASSGRAIPTRRLQLSTRPWRWRSKGLITGEGMPVHSVCLADDGRRLAE